MKKILFILLFLNTYWLNSQVVFQGNMMLDGYLGFPNFGKALMIGNLSNYTALNFNGLAPSGVRGEYLISDNLGVGFDFIRNFAEINYKEMDTAFVGENIVVNSNDVQSLMRRTRVHLRLNYHFETFNSRFDTYFGFGIGSNYRHYNSTKNGLDNTSELKDRIQLIPIPISMRVCAGARYFFSSYAGIVGEFGFGGPLISLGVTLKY